MVRRPWSQRFLVYPPPVTRADVPVPSSPRTLHICIKACKSCDYPGLSGWRRRRQSDTCDLRRRVEGKGCEWRRVEKGGYEGSKVRAGGEKRGYGGAGGEGWRSGSQVLSCRSDEPFGLSSPSGYCIIGIARDLVGAVNMLSHNHHP